MAATTAFEYGFILLFFGSGALGYGLWKLRPVYHILRNDPISVRDLVYHDGPAEVEGTAELADDGDVVRAPCSDIDCLAYEYEVQEYRSSSNNSYWKTLDEGSDAAPFLVEDETGTVRVDPTGATLEFEPETVKVPAGEEPPDTIAQYLRETEAVDPQHDKTVNLVVTELNTGNDQRFIERRLDIGESVYVYGDVEDAPAGEWGSRLVDAVLTRGEAADLLVISDTSERGTAWRLGKRPLLWTLAGLVLTVPGLVLLGFWLWSVVI